MVSEWYFLYCFERNKIKLSCCNENIQHCCFKKLKWNIISKLKFNGANNCIHLPHLQLLCMTSFLWIELKYRVQKVETPCDVTIVYVKSWPYYAYMTIVLSTLGQMDHSPLPSQYHSDDRARGAEGKWLANNRRGRTLRNSDIMPNSSYCKASAQSWSYCTRVFRLTRNETNIFLLK